jgi:Outer membrane protein beta-barrel domain
MKHQYTAIACVLFFFFSNVKYTLYAQEYGFKIGTNLTSFIGQKEKDAAGNILESYRPELGFQFGFVSSYPLSDNTGFRIEMLYTQKSMSMNYVGEAVKVFYTQGTNQRVLTKGMLNSHLKITNNYFEVPLTFYGKSEGGFEFAAGASFAFLAGSRGKGEMTFEGNTEGGYAIPQYTSQLDFNYSKDKDSTAVLSPRTTQVEGNAVVRLPESIGAYYENRAAEKSRFNTLDIGLIGDIRYWFNDKVAINLHATYSLKDVTNNASDFSQCKIDSNKNLTTQDDFDKFLTYQFSFVFKF